jgi:hypothetical protein
MWYRYPQSDAPQFIPGGSANAAVCIFVAGLAFVIRIIHQRENRKLERYEDEGQVSVKEEGERRGKGFRYVV